MHWENTLQLQSWQTHTRQNIQTNKDTLPAYIDIWCVILMNEKTQTLSFFIKMTLLQISKEHVCVCVCYCDVDMMLDTPVNTREHHHSTFQHKCDMSDVHRDSLSKSIFSTMFLGLTLSSWLWMKICPSSFSVQPYLFIQTFTWVSVKRITFLQLYSHNQESMCYLMWVLLSPRGSPNISASSRYSMFWYVIPTTWQMTWVRQRESKQVQI